MPQLSLIFPHQLFSEHPALANGAPALLIEDPLLYGTDAEKPLALHAKKRILLKAAGDAWLADHPEVECIPLPAEPTRTDLLLEKCVPQEIDELVCVDPTDYLLDRRLRRFAESRGISLTLLPSPNFVTPDDWMTATMDGMKKPFMKTFYEAQRQRMNVLIDEDGGPVGGKYSYDADNRKKLPAKQAVPEPYSSPGHECLDSAAKWVAERFDDSLGSPAGFNYPVTREQAHASLEQFFKERFELFGDYEDAISTKHRVAFHAVLTPALNIGLISPEEVIDSATAYAAEHDIPLNSLEGFIRQIIGWREFMRIIYKRHGVQERTENFWGFTGKMPESFYNGTTGIEPVDHAIHALLDDAYNHHIERLMVLGNFMLLCRIHPDEVYKWFMELYIDAYDWVMVPNVYGMSQFADGGVFSTKPYISGSNYIRKMSDFKKGEWCDTWDALYWTFIDNHREFFAKNYRLSMMVRLWDKMADDKKETHRKNSEAFLKKIGVV